MKKSLKLVAAFAVVAMMTVFATQARADLVIGFSTDGSTFSNSFNVDVGNSIVVQVFALEIAENRLSTVGLQNLGTRATFASNFGNVSDASVDTGNFTDAGSGFDNSVPELALRGFTFTAATGSEVSLGSFTFDATAAGTTTFAFGDFNTASSSSDFTLFDGTDVDGDFFGAARDGTFDVDIVSSTAVPEPASAALLGLGMGLLFVKRRR